MIHFYTLYGRLARNCLQTALLLMITAFFSLLSCTRRDFTTMPPHEPGFEQSFFNTTPGTSAPVQRIIQLLWEKNEKTGFVKNLPAHCGLPLWQKLAVQKSRGLLRGGDSSSTIIIPLTESNQSLSSILVATQEEDSISTVTCYDVNHYLYSICHTPGIDTTWVKNQLLLFFFMENRSFGTTIFYHLPNHLFTANTKTGEDGKRVLEMVPPAGGDSTNNFISVEICVKENHCPYTPGFCLGPGGSCDNCLAVCATVDCHTIIIGGGYPNNFPTGGGTTGPFPPMPGGGSGGGGGGGNLPGPGNCIPPIGGEAWYNFIPEPNPCGPLPPLPEPPPQDTILDVCGDANQLTTSASFISYLQEMKDSLNSPTGNNREFGYLIARDTLGVFGNTDHGLLQGMPNKLGLPDIINANIIGGMVHSHFNANGVKGLPVFSPDDIFTMCANFNSGNIQDPAGFEMALVTPTTQYLLKIENLTKFRKWAKQFCSMILDGHYMDFHMRKIKPSNSDSDNEKLFLIYLQEYMSGSGLKLFRGNSSFSEWQPIRYNASTEIVENAPCQ
jgi:hypothetical protein